jgi:hypothetical protein
MDIKNIAEKVKLKLADKNYSKISEIENFFKSSIQLPMVNNSTLVLYDPNTGNVKIHSGDFKGNKAIYEIETGGDGHILLVDGKRYNFKSAKECFKKIEAIETGEEKKEEGVYDKSTGRKKVKIVKPYI